MADESSMQVDDTESKKKDEKETVEEKPKPVSTEMKEEDRTKRPDNLCCYSQKLCDLQKLKGFNFCHKHILEDKESPFRPCSFVSKSTGKKCTNPAPKTEKEKTYCLNHTKDSELRKVIEERSKKHKRKLSETSDISGAFIIKEIPKKTQSKKFKTSEGDFSKRDEMLRVESSWHGDHESDTESLDNEIDEPLRHAGIWTAEEVTKICRDKLLRLRSLYMSQFERLKHVFKNKRRKYILGSTNDEADSNNRNKSGSKAVTAFDIAAKKYNKRFRTDALLQKQSKDKRFGGSPKTQQILPHQRCTHYSEGDRCVLKIIPATRFCLKHICFDPNQVLFLPCSHEQEQNICGIPVPNILQHDKCTYHLPHDSELVGENVKEKIEKAKEIQEEKENERKRLREERLKEEERVKQELLERVKQEHEESVRKQLPTNTTASEEESQKEANDTSSCSAEQSIKKEPTCQATNDGKPQESQTKTINSVPDLKTKDTSSSDNVPSQVKDNQQVPTSKPTSSNQPITELPNTNKTAGEVLKTSCENKPTTELPLQTQAQVKSGTTIPQ